MANNILNIKGRLSFEHVFKPSSTDNSEPAYSATILLPKDDSQIAKIRAVIQEVAKERWKDKAPAILRNLIAENKINLRDGDNKDYDGYEGMMYVTARNSVRPTVVDRKCAPVAEEDGIVYSGCYIVARVEFWAQDNKQGKRINGKLLGIQFVKDGDRFGAGSGPAKASDFEVLDDEEDDADETKPWE